MIKKYKKYKQPTMRRSSRVYIEGWLNKGKVGELKKFLVFYRNLTQYFIDLYWSSKDFSSSLSPLPIIHKGRDRFSTTTRLSQAAAKQAKQVVKAAHTNKGRRPQLKNASADLCYHFVTIETFDGSFNLAVKLGGAGVPKLIVPCKSTEHLNKKLQRGWKISKSIRVGIKNKKLYIDFILEKPLPSKKSTGETVGLDSNYKNGFVISEDDMYGKDTVKKIKSFPRRKKRTQKYIKDLTGRTINSIDLSRVKTLVIENLKNVRKGTKGKFPKAQNRRFSYWHYAYAMDLLARRCEEEGVTLLKKHPAYTSQFCRICGKYEKRNRNGDKFKCIHCGHENHADVNAAENLKLLGLAGSYGIRSLKESDCYTF